MADKILIRRDTAANWTYENPVLSSGEYGVETDTNRFKVGDGVTAWESLGYFVNELSKGYKEYVGLLNFVVSPEEVTTTVLKTDFGEIVVAHPSINAFTFTLSGAFTADKTAVLCSNITNYYAKSYRFSDSAVAIYFVKYDGTVNSIESFTSLSVMIRVYD